jgi:hypothetical protein
MRKILFSLLISSGVISSAFSQSRTYFVSSEGNDNNSGLSLKTSWKTLSRVNTETFRPGDIILFRSGDVWKGQLHPAGSGADGKPIIVDRYGEGSMPVINMGEAKGAAVKLVNQEWWKIQNIEVTSGFPPRLEYGRQGIVALAEGRNKHTGHIEVRNCYIHDIWGQLGGDSLYTGYNSAAIYAGRSMGRGGSGGSADDIFIENNRIERVDRCGIIVIGGTYNIVVRGNTMENLGGDGIFVQGCIRGLIEHNIARRTCMHSGDPDIVMKSSSYNPHTAAMWIQNCIETVMQFNEVYDTGRQKGNGDGNAYDFDFECKDCIVQYNYSRNNHGFLLIMYRTYGNIARYNISENDQTHLIQMQGNISDRNQIYNNVFYVDYGTADLDFYMGGREIDDATKSLLGAYIRNNIFYATGQGRFRTAYTYGSALERQYNDKVKLPHPAPGTMFHHNWYFGPWLNGLPDDPEKMEGDPMFAAPGTGGIGLSTLTGYKLQPGSPCINKGIPVAMNGNRDFFGNPLNDGIPDFGAFEQIGSGAVSDTAAENKLNRYEKAAGLFAWTKRKFPDMVAIPSEGGNVTVAFNMFLQGSMASATRLDTLNRSFPVSVLAWSSKDWNIQPKVGEFTKKNTGLTFKLTPNKKEPSIPVLIASMKDGDQKDEWNIPVYVSRKVEMGNLADAEFTGDLERWKNIPALEVNNISQVFQLREKWSGPQDGSCSLKAAKSGDNLLLAVDVTDAEISNDASIPTRNDAVEICFDSRLTVAASPGTGAPATQAGRPGMASIGQIILLAQKNDGPVEKAFWLQRRNTVPLPAEIKTFCHRTQKGYTLEISVPFRLLGFNTTPVKGDNIALEVVLDNLTGTGTSAYMIRMNGAGNATFLTNSKAFSRFVVK